MKQTRTGFTLLALLIAFSFGLLAQSTPTAPADQDATPAAKSASTTTAPDQAAAYYHFAMAHIYEEMVSMYGQSEYANKAIDEYRLAIENDPTSDYLNAGLAELYARTGRIKDAVLEAQDILKRDGNNLEAHRLLGRIYLRSLGDMQSGTQSEEILKLAIEQYEEIVRLDPKSVEDHLLLGRLYRLNNDLVKAENEFKTAVKLQPTSEDAVTALSILYNEEGDTSRALEVLNAFPEASRSSKLYSALGYTYEQNKAYKKAIEAYQKSVDLDHDNLDSVRGLAQNLLNDGQTDAALTQFKVIAEADPSDSQTYMRIAEIYRRSGRYDEALESLKKASAIVPDSLEVKFNIAVIDQAQGQYDDAITILNAVAAEDRAHERRVRRLGEEQPRRSSWSGWARSIATRTSRSWQSTPSAACSTWAMNTPFAATRRSSRPIATRNSGSRPPAPRRKPPRGFPTIARCRWLPRRSALTWATRPRPSRRSSRC